MSPLRDAPRFGRVVTAMVTPFDDAGALDIDASVELARWLAGHGSDEERWARITEAVNRLTAAGKAA